MGDEAIWSLEERFWTGGEEHYSGTLDPECAQGHREGARPYEAYCTSTYRAHDRWLLIQHQRRDLGPGGPPAWEPSSSGECPRPSKSGRVSLSSS